MTKRKDDKREKRLAEALRQNLQRRKQQSRALKTTDAQETPHEKGADDPQTTRRG